MDLLQVFENLNLDWLDKGWANSIWDSDFIIYTDPPNEYHAFARDKNIGLLLRKCSTAAKTWLAKGKNENIEGDLDVSWQALIAKGVNVRSLLPVLGYIIKSGQHEEADSDSILLCIRATTLYFVLLAVPGSNAFNIFSPNLYQRAIETLKLLDIVMPSIERKKPSNAGSFYLINQEESNSLHLSCLQKNSLMDALSNMISTFTDMIKFFSFKEYIKSLDVTIQILLDVTRLEADCNLFGFENNGKGTMTLSYHFYTALESLCDSRHCSADVTTMLIAKHILPCLSFAGSNMQVKLSTNFCETFVNFLKMLSDSYEVETNAAIFVLIHHLMTQNLERLEKRQKQSVVIIKLMQICNESTVVKTIDNLILLSYNSKVTSRIFAQEIIGRLLSDTVNTNDDLREELRLKIKRTLIATVLSRCVDRSSMVRSKAISIIADYTDGNDNITKIFESSREDAELPTIDQFRTSLSDSSDPLPSMQVTIKILIDRVEDERAQVRRYALQILKNVGFACPDLLRKISTKIGERSRDPALSVRRYAVQVLTNLLERYSDNTELLDEWTRNVMPLIFDVEVKVQEKTLESLQDILLNRINRVAYSKQPEDEDPATELPWRILQRLTSMKMRKHLSKACNLWVKNGTITKTVVKNIQSHINTKNDTFAWVLLVAIAESQKLQGMHEYIANYKELIRKNDFHACLVLEVLRSSWTSFEKPVLEDLYFYLYNSICLFDIDFGLVSICMDILTGVTKHLDPANGEETVKSNVSKFIDLAEAELQKFLESEDKVMEAVPIFLKAMSTLGQAALLCPEKVIQPSTLRILEGLILEYDSLPVPLKKIEELRACTVVLLSQLATRDREVAQEVIPIFGRLVRQTDTETNSPSEVAVKVNAVKALADLCVRHTALVEPYLSDMCVSMRDPDPVLREVILVIFIQLLLEDFIKANRPFFFHILTMLSDGDKTIRELTVFLIEERLLTKNKVLISQRFLEGIYHYNNYRFPRELCDRRMREKERNTLTLPGVENEKKRRVIYDFMLEHLDPPGKLKLIVKLTSQILGGACSGSINVRRPEGSCVLKDALYIISNPRIRPSLPSEKNVDEEEESTPEQPLNNAINILVESAKKHGLDVLLPVLTKLWKKLVADESYLQKNVKVFLLRKLSEYDRNQLADLFMEYPDLEREASNARRSGKDTDSENEESSEETSPPSTPIISQSSKSHMYSAILKQTPRVVLRRLSFLECQGTYVNRENLLPGSSTNTSPSDRNGFVASTPKSQTKIANTQETPSRHSTPIPTKFFSSSPLSRTSPTNNVKLSITRKNLSRLESESECD